MSIEIQHENDRSGNAISTLRIDPEVANALVTNYPLDSGNSLYSGLYEAIQASNTSYEREIRAIRTQPVESLSPEIRQIITSMDRGGLTVVDFRELQPSSAISIDFNKEINSSLTDQDRRTIVSV